MYRRMRGVVIDIFILYALELASGFYTSNEMTLDTPLYRY